MVYYRKRYRRKKRGYAKKLTVAKMATKRRRYRKLHRVPRFPLSKSKRVTLTYHDTFNLDVGAAGVPAHYIFSANGMYDPNITGVGHQPRGFDQLMTFFDHYTVLWSKISVTAVNADNTNGNFVVISVRDSSTTIASPDDIMEYPCVYTSLSAEGSGINNKTISHSVNVSKWLGRPSLMSEDDLRGTTSANPVEQLYFHISSLPAPAGTDTQVVYCRARIIFDAVLTEPKQPISS